MCYATSNTQVNLKLRLNNHRKDVNKRNSLQANQQFRLPGDNFNKYAKFPLIEQLTDINIDKELLKYRLKMCEDFWIIKLKTLQPHEFNAELNFPDP